MSYESKALSTLKLLRSQWISDDVTWCNEVSSVGQGEVSSFRHRVQSAWWQLYLAVDKP